jgi:ribosomal protein S19
MKFKLIRSDVNKIRSLTFRNGSIPPYMIGRRIRVYNGAWYLVQVVNLNMVGTKFGEYSVTKRFDMHKKGRSKSKKKTKKA